VATPTTHPEPDLPEATWAAIRAAVKGILASSPGNAPGFVAVAKACRAARRQGRIPGCSNQQLDAALKYLADQAEFGSKDSTPGPVATPKNDPLKININRFLDVVYDEQAGRARVLVGGKPFLHCSFIVASIQVDNNDDGGKSPAANNRNSSSDGTSTIDSIDDLAASLQHDARILEGPDVRQWLTPAEEILAHASNLQAWAENDYDTRLLHSNIAFPLLKELAKNGDEKAARIFYAEIETRLSHGNAKTRIATLELCGDCIVNPTILFQLLEDEVTAYEAMRIIVHLVSSNNQATIRYLQENFTKMIQNGSEILLHAIALEGNSLIIDPDIALSFLKFDGNLSCVIVALARMVREGNARASNYLDAEVKRRLHQGSLIDRFTILDSLISVHQDDLTFSDFVVEFHQDQHLNTKVISEIYFKYFEDDPDLLSNLLQDDNPTLRSLSIDLLELFIRDNFLPDIETLISKYGSSIRYAILTRYSDELIHHPDSMRILLTDDATRRITLDLLTRISHGAETSSENVAINLLQEDLENRFPSRYSKEYAMSTVEFFADQISLLELKEYLREDPTMYLGLILFLIKVWYNIDRYVKYDEFLQSTKELTKVHREYDRISTIITETFTFLPMDRRQRLANKFQACLDEKTSRLDIFDWKRDLLAAIPTEIIEPILDYILHRPAFWTLWRKSNEDIWKVLEDIIEAWISRDISNEVLARAATHPDTIIRWFVARRTKIPEEIIIALLNAEEDPFEELDVIDHLLEDQFSEPILLAVMRYATPNQRQGKSYFLGLSVLSHSMNTATRLEVARCPDLYNDMYVIGDGSLIDEIVSRLAADPDPIVAAAAREGIAQKKRKKD
jgi:hypothetical protein